MKRFLTYFSAIAIIAAVAVSCQEDSVEDAIPSISDSTSTTGTTLYVSKPSTRVSFTETTDSEGKGLIDLDWENGDTFSVYYTEAGTKVGDFTCAVAGDESEFTSNVALTNDSYYTAIYPASSEDTLDEAKDAILDSVSTQNGEKIDSLDASCYMLATFKYGSSETITFVHQMAIMKFTFTDDKVNDLTKLVFENGDDYYTVNYTASPLNGSSSYLMINPCTATSRTLSVSFYVDNEDIPSELYTVTTTIAYLAGEYYSTTLEETTLGWNHVGISEYTNGSGTETSPYEISSADDMVNLSTMVAYGIIYENCYFKLTNDIDLSSNLSSTWTPIGRSSTDQFAGIFDGGGYEIKLDINSASGKQGLFGYLAPNGVICNLGVSGSVTSYNEYGVCWETAGIAAYNHGLIINCYNSATVSGNANVGGIVGFNEDGGSVVNCYNTGAITGTDTDTDDGGYGRNIGGLVGQNDSDASVLYSYNRGAVSGGSKTVRVGGAVGYNVSSSGKVSGCYSLGEWGSDEVLISHCIGMSGSSAYDDNQLTTGDMTGATLLNNLNDYVSTYNTDANGVESCKWESGSDGYPVHVYYSTDTTAEVATN